VGYRNLPVFLNERADAPETHDAEEYGRVTGGMRGVARAVTMRRRSAALSVDAASALSRQLDTQIDNVFVGRKSWKKQLSRLMR
jgi:hypothetical protein